MSLFRDNIEAMASYVPGEQPGADERVIKLNTNENPYPPSPAALKALREYDGERLRLYPDPMANRFCRTAADVLDIPADWIIPGDGSDDLIMMIARSCAGPGRPVVYPTPTFPFYLTQAQIEDAPVEAVDCGDDFALPVEKLLIADGAVTFVANPNTPTGTMASNERLATLAEGLSGLLVIDEAYVDFADADALELVHQFDNVLVIRTLSKGYGLAGLRLGFGIAQPGLLEGLVKTKSIYNVSGIADAVGAAAMADQSYKNECVVRVKASREALRTDLERLGFAVWPSAANFLLTRPPAGDAERIYRQLKDRGILVRYFKNPPLDDKLRITIGTEAQNAELIDAMAELVGGA